MLGALKSYIYSQSKDGAISPNFQVILDLVHNIETSGSDHIKFGGKSHEGLVYVSINTMMALRGVRIDISKIVDVTKLNPDLAEALHIICTTMEKSIQEAYNDAQSKIINTMIEAAKNSENNNQ
jgi:hypothetical protein